jgi:endonuclease YncB( thermonuclease family)
LTFALVLPLSARAEDIPSPTPPANGELATVVDVTDGDTIRVDRGDGGYERLRYIGIDTPETVKPDTPVEPWGPQASAANEALVADQVVLLERDVSDTDQYDRLLRYVWVEGSNGWILVNAELVAQGLAEVRSYQPDTKHDRYLRQVEDRARSAGTGLHSPLPPTDDGDLLGQIFEFLFGDG